MTRPKTSDRAVQDRLREAMRAAGLSYAEIAEDFGRRFRMRPRAAWRVAYGWTLQETADRINDLLRERGLDRGGKARMTSGHLCEYEQWPGPLSPGRGRRAEGRKPTPQLLSLLAQLYDTTVASLLDFDDYQWMPEAERLFYGTAQTPENKNNSQISNGATAVAVPGTAGVPAPGVPAAGVPVIAGPAAAGRGNPGEALIRVPGSLPGSPPGIAGAGAGGRWVMVPADVPGGFAYRQVKDTGVDGFWTLDEVIMAAAHEGGEQAERAERREIGEATLEQFREDVIRLSGGYMSGEPFLLFLEMRRVRNRIYAALDRRHQPRDATELNLLIACVNGLMADAANNLGYPAAAEELNRSGWAHATAIDHRPMMAWLRANAAHVAYWNGRPLRALTLARSGLEYLDRGQNAADLYSLTALAAARTGDVDETRRAITAADEVRGREHHDELLEIGGSFNFSQATQRYLAGFALTVIPQQITADAVTELRRSTELYDAGPAQGEDHQQTSRMRAHADLAIAGLRSGQLDAAPAALEPVMALSPANRTALLSQRITVVRTELAAPIYQGSATARDLDGQLEEWLGDTIADDLAALPSASG
jgi:hypothetical protein